MELEIVRVPRIDRDCGACCLEDCLATFAKYAGRRYEMYHLGNWRFQYDEDKDCDRIGEKFELIYQHNVDDLKQFHGIEMALLGKRPIEELIDIVEIDTANQLPVLLEYDAYWCPWDWGFQRYHNPHHAFLITGVDLEARAFICTDPFFSKTSLKLPFDLYDSGVTGVKRLSLLEPEPVSYAGMLQAVADRANRYNNPVTNRGMSMLIEEIDQRFDLLAERQGGSDMIPTPFHFGLVFMTENRIGYSQALKYIAERYQSTEMMEMADRYWKIANEWMKVRRLLYKMDHSGQTLEPLKQSMVRIMKKIFALETELVGRIDALAESAKLPDCH